MRVSINKLAALAAAALLLAGCGGGASSGPSSSSMAGASSGAGQAGAAAKDWRSGLAVITEGESEGAGGELRTIAAAVVLDEEGRIVRAVVDELEVKADASSGALALPDDLRTKRQKGDDYPLAAVSEIGKSWAEQADALAEHLEGMTAAEAAALETDEEGYAADPDLLAGCTIRVSGYRDAIAEACRNAQPLR